QYYSSGYTPYDEFGRLLFGDWDKSEWCMFDNFLVYCLQLSVNFVIKKIFQVHILYCVCLQF
ncbi:MAG: hypothetical protein ACR2M9_02690, partial [Cyanophyceae cyanobacterium]